MSVFIPNVINSYLLIGLNVIGKLLDASWADIVETVGLSEVMMKFPLGFA